MSVISGQLSSAITRAAASQALAEQPASTTSSSGSGSAFGPAANVTLSPAAQAAVSAPPPPAPSSGSGAGGGISIPLTSTSDTTDSTLLVAIAKAQIIPKVGVTGASLVVDSQGNIDQVKLEELVNAQEAKAAAQKVAS